MAVVSLFATIETRTLLTSDKGFQRVANRFAFPYRRVYKIQEIGLRMTQVEIGGLCCVDNRASADSDERVELALPSEINGFPNAESSEWGDECYARRRVAILAK